MPTRLVTDTSCLLTLVTCGRASELTEALDLRLLTTRSAIDETASSAPANRAVLDTLTDLGRLDVVELDHTDETLDVLVRCAEHLPDQDAALLALARTQKITLASDDGCQRRVAGRLFVDLDLTSTPALLAEAADALGLDDAARRALVVDVHTRSRFLPAPDDPLRGWFFAQQVIGGTDGDATDEAARDDT